MEHRLSQPQFNFTEADCARKYKYDQNSGNSIFRYLHMLDLLQH